MPVFSRHRGFVRGAVGHRARRPYGYEAVILADTPYGYWALDEAAGTIANDLSGGPNPGTYVASPTLGVTGPLQVVGDTAVAFNGTTQYVTIPGGAGTGLQVGDQFSIEAWVRYPVSGGLRAIVSLGTNGPYLRINGTTSGPSDRMELVKSNVALVIGSTIGFPVDTNYHHVVVTKNGALSHLYIDAVDVSGTITNQTMASVSTPIYIGSDNLVEFYNNDIGEVALYGVVLTAAQVLAHYNAAGYPLAAAGGLDFPFEGGGYYGQAA
jgi:hypothetical protein